MVKCSNCSYDINSGGEFELICGNCSRVDLDDLSDVRIGEPTDKG